MKILQTGSTPALPRRGFLKQSFLAGSAAVSWTALSSRRVLGANDRLGFGVIGTGGRGHSHLDAIDKLKADHNLAIVAVCDAFRPRLQAAAGRYSVPKQYMDHRELLQDPNVDAVSIATPDHWHGYQALDAIEAGKDVYCEKPVTHWRQFDLTKRLAHAVEKSNQVFQLGTQGMSDGAWSLMRQLVQDGLIGQLIHAECGFFRIGDWGERGMPIDDPNAKPGDDLKWETFLGDSPERPFDVSRFFRWRMYRDYAGGPATDLFPHSLTPTLNIMGVGMPGEVVAVGGILRYEEREVPDTYNMLINYPERITVACLGTQGNSYNATGARGSGQRIPVIRGWEGSLTVEKDEVVFIPVEGSKAEPRCFPIEKGESFLDFYSSFITCIRKRQKETLSPMHLAYKVQTTLHMGMLALHSGKTAQFDREKEEIVI